MSELVQNWFSRIARTSSTRKVRFANQFRSLQFVTEREREREKEYNAKMKLYAQTLLQNAPKPFADTASRF